MVLSVARVLEEVGGPQRVVAAGLANQGETVVAWDAEDGRALAPAIGWQCRRSLPIVERLRAAGLEGAIRERSGLPLDPYYSAGKLAWLLEHNEEVRTASAQGRLRFGTVDAWLTARLDGGDARTDTSTASRTQLLGLGSLAWDRDLLGWFGISAATLPRLVATAGDLGQLAHPRWRGALALRAMACDQQAALGRTWRVCARGHQGNVRHGRLRARERRQAPGLRRPISRRRSRGPCPEARRRPTRPPRSFRAVCFRPVP